MERPVSDKDGKLTALLEPGKQRIGVGHRKSPTGYLPDRDGQELDCEAGETLRVTFELTRSAAK